MHYIHIGLAPKYLSDCVYTVSAASRRYRLRSTGSEAYILPRTRTRFGELGFFYSGPAAWKTLPSDLHDITAFNWFCWRSWTCRIAAPYKFCVDWLIECRLDVCSSGSTWRRRWRWSSHVQYKMVRLWLHQKVSCLVKSAWTTNSMRTVMQVWPSSRD